MSSTLRVGVVGLGMGSGHIAAFNAHPAARVVAVADIDAERLQKVTEEMGVEQTFTEYESMLAKADLDVVSVALPNYLHKPVTIAAIEAGCHVLCEKPMAMNAGEARDMIAAADKAGKRLMINFNQRFQENNHMLKRQIDAGLFGHVYYARSVWHRRRGMPRFGGWFGVKEKAGGGPLIDLGVHKLDLALWMMGYPKPVYVLGSTYDYIASEIARRSKREYDVEDFAAAVVKFDNGATLMLEASWASHIDKEYQEFQVLGTTAGYCAGPGMDTKIHSELNDCHVDMELTRCFVDGPPSAMYNLIDCIVNDAEPVVTAHQGMIVMEILDALYESSRTNAPVAIK